MILPFLLNSLNMQSAISFNLSECAKTLEAKIKSAFFLIFFRFFFSKKPLKVFILFLFASFAKFFAGSIPSTFLKPKAKKGFNATPSLLPISIIYDFLADNLNSFTYFLPASIK